MKIAILNNCFFNENHMQKLKKLGEIIVYENTNTEDLAIERLNNVNIAIVDQFSTKYTEKILKSNPNLKLLALNTTSYSDVDLESAKNLGISVANVPGFSKQSTAELTIGIMFSVIRKIAYGDYLMKQNPLELDPENIEHREKFMGFDIYGKTLGVIGLGNIGSIVANIGKALGMNIISYNNSQKQTDINLVSLDTLLKNSDVVSIHLPLNEETKNFINKNTIEKMKDGAVIISTARPEVTNIDDIYKALISNKLSGFGIDIGGKLPKEHPVTKLSNVVLTPHIGSFTNESFYQNMPNIIISNIEDFINNNPKNIVNK